MKDKGILSVLWRLKYSSNVISKLWNQLGQTLLKIFSVTLPRQKMFLCFRHVLKNEVSQGASSYEFYTQVRHKGTTKVVSPQRIIKIHVTCTSCDGGVFGCSVSFVAGRLYDFVACWLTSGRYKSDVAASWFCWSYRTSSCHNRPLSVNTVTGSLVQLITPLNGIIILPRVILRIAQTGTF